MYFNSHISVTIINAQTLKEYPIRDIVSVHIENDAAHIGASCDVVMPLKARIPYDNGKKGYLTDSVISLFSTGDKIVVKAKYDGSQYSNIKSADGKTSYTDENGFLTVFEGFLYDFTEGNPIKISCQDYVYLLNQKPISISYPSKTNASKTVKLKTLIEKILEGTGVTMMNIEKTYQKEGETTRISNPMFDFTLQNITFAMMTPAAILNWIKKEMGINISLDRDKLYVNVASNTTETCKLDTTINVLKSDLQTTNLTRSKRANAVFLNIKVKAWFIRTDGKKDFIEYPENSDGQLREVYFYNIPINQTKYKQMAIEAYEKFKQRRYNGTVETMLYPMADLFWRVEYTDYRYPEKNGVYVITKTSIDISESGYRRTHTLAYLGELAA